MKRWKSQTKREPYWVQIQLESTWVAHNDGITYIEIHFNSEEMQKLERVLHHKQIVDEFHLARHGSQVFFCYNVD
jgi:hypothetical protein